MMGLQDTGSSRRGSFFQYQRLECRDDGATPRPRQRRWLPSLNGKAACSCFFHLKKLRWSRIDPSKVVFDGLYLWAQIHNIPERYRQEPVVDELAKRIGRVREVQMTPNLVYEGGYIRVRARVNVAKGLTRFVPLNVVGEGRKLLPVKYEKVPYFCKVCGLMGHSHEECGDGVWEAKDKQYDSWMIAQRKVIQNSPFQSRAPMGARGQMGGRGRGQQEDMGSKNSTKRSSDDAALDADKEKEDTATNPLKASEVKD